MLAHRVLLNAIEAAHVATAPDAAAWSYLTQTPDALTRPAVLAWPVKMTRQPNGGRRVVVSTVELWIVTPLAQADSADTALDDLAEELIGILEATPAVAWTELERGVLDDKFHGWQAVVTLAHHLTETTP